jgi:hypothetical protein
VLPEARLNREFHAKVIAVLIPDGKPASRTQNPASRTQYPVTSIIRILSEIMNNQDKIIVLQNFDTSLEANLAKTKLDAYGIPCFLTGENLANLYPVNNPKFSGVRLHLFLNDAVQARQILSDVVPVAEEELTRCPRCRSAHIEIAYTKKFSARILTILMSVFFALFPPRKVYQCLDCEHEF